MIFFFDLDGPILDVSEKYYRVYADLLASRSMGVIPKEEYWECKRAQIPEVEILQRSGATSLFEWYKEERIRIIESDDYMRYDRLQDDCIKVLADLYKKYELVICTLRTTASQLDKELTAFDIKKYFEDILNNEANIVPRWKVKYNLITGRFDEERIKDAFFIGDTETDILAGKNLGCKTIGVSNGIRTLEKLALCDPDHLVNSVGEILDLDIF